MPDDVLYRETQRFRQPLLWAVLVLIACLQFAGFAPALYGVFVRGEPWAAHPASPVGIVAVTMAVALLVTFWFAELVTEVRADGLYCRFRPLQRRPRRLAWADIKSYEAVTYRPIREYGGWGIRVVTDGVAYSVSGNRGVRVKQVSGSHVLVGSQDPDKLVEAIRAARRAKRS